MVGSFTLAPGIGGYGYVDVEFVGEFFVVIVGGNQSQNLVGGTISMGSMRSTYCS